MVGIGTGLSDFIDGLIHRKALQLQQTDQLRDHHGRMGIIDLDRHILMQMMQIRTPFLCLF